MENQDIKPQWIIVKTNQNERTVALLDFFNARICPQGECLCIAYENNDQIPSICRLLVDVNIDIMEIYLSKV